MRTAGLIALAACGRVGFATAVDAPPQEVCNGIDDDGDGQVDEGCPCTAFDEVLPVSVADLVWIGTGFAAITVDQTNATVSAIGADGVLGASISIDPTGVAGVAVKHSMVWTGEEIGVAWRAPTDNTIELSELDATFTAIRTTQIGAMASTPVRVRWTGTRFGAVWIESSDTVELAEIAPGSTAVTGGGTAFPLDGYYDLAAVAGGYLVAFDGFSEQLVMVDPTGAATVPPAGAFVGQFELRPGPAGVLSFPSFSATQTQLLDAFGNPAPPIDLPTTADGMAFASLDAAAAGTFRVVGTTQAPGAHLLAAELAADGTPIGVAEDLGAIPMATSYGTPSVVAAAGRYAWAFAYQDTTGAFTRLVQVCE